jgi:hypothetical protein
MTVFRTAMPPLAFINVFFICEPFYDPLVIGKTPMSFINVSMWWLYHRLLCAGMMWWFPYNILLRQCIMVYFIQFVTPCIPLFSK